MPVIKYRCPKCGRRFTEWGAEKAGFRCPSDQWSGKDQVCDGELVRLGREPAAPQPTLQRRPAPSKAKVAAETGAEDELASSDANSADEELEEDVLDTDEDGVDVDAEEDELDDSPPTTGDEDDDWS
jgi:hypothetical protein